MVAVKQLNNPHLLQSRIIPIVLSVEVDTAKKVPMVVKSNQVNPHLLQSRIKLNPHLSQDGIKLNPQLSQAGIKLIQMKWQQAPSMSPLKLQINWKTTSVWELVSNILQTKFPSPHVVNTSNRDKVLKQGKSLYYGNKTSGILNRGMIRWYKE